MFELKNQDGENKTWLQIESSKIKFISLTLFVKKDLFKDKFISRLHFWNNISLRYEWLAAPLCSMWKAYIMLDAAYIVINKLVNPMNHTIYKSYQKSCGCVSYWFIAVWSSMSRLQ